MKYLEIVNKLGGIKPVYGEEDKINLNELNKLQSIFSKPFPIDYKDFILRYPICTFNEWVVFNPFNNNAEYVHPVEDNYPIYTFEGSSVDVFFSKDKDVYDLNWNLKNYNNRIPDNMLPIFTDGMGNLGLLSLQDDTYEKVYFWDHEFEWDVDDYFEETGKKIHDDVKYQNLWLIGNNFTDFLSRCYICED